MDIATGNRIIYMGIMFALGVSMIVKGALFKDDCPIQPYIPIFLIVGGATHLALLATYFLRFVFEIFSLILESLLGLFSFAWFITGNIWVFSIYSKYEGKCDSDLYMFAFGYLIAIYAAIGITLILFCFFCCLFSPRTSSYESLE